MTKVRNIVLTYKIHTISYVEQWFIDWYDVADWLKQRELGHEIVVIKGWRYEDRRLRDAT
jgi:hypothetical protein